MCSVKSSITRCIGTVRARVRRYIIGISRQLPMCCTVIWLIYRDISKIFACTSDVDVDIDIDISHDSTVGKYGSVASTVVPNLPEPDNLCLRCLRSI